jgi:hypothetical protein
MPDDLKYVAVVESALRPHAGSKKGAVGFWQFLPATGRKFGLTVNARTDERRNVFASTRAALRYLKDLREAFGSWSLAVAAFNMGEEGLLAETMEQEATDYYQLYLPLETQRFIFRILSVKLIFDDPVKYGFHLQDNDYYPPLEYDTVRIECFEDTPIRIVARAAKTRFKVIKDMNPEIRGHYLASGTHSLLVPKGTAKGFEERYRERVTAFVETRKERMYVIQEGDNLSAIAARFEIPLAALAIWNRLDIRKPIHPGDTLIIYRPSPELPANGEEHEEQ